MGIFLPVKPWQDLTGGGISLEVFLLLFDEVRKSHYEILGIPKTAAETEVKRAYFGMVRKYQPDRFPEEFKEIRAAYETLIDGQKRAEYDAIGELPPSVASFFHEALRFDRFGRHGKAAELYRMILKSHPELDNVREQYALSLSADDKSGKAVEVWEELCHRHPGNPHYARELGKSYFDRSWHKKALAETRRALALDSSSIDAWSLLISCTIAQGRDKPLLDTLETVSREALEAVKGVRTDEWKKVQIYTYAFITGGIKKIDTARGYLREIVRLIRESGRDGQEEGRHSLTEILTFIPGESLTGVYPELKEAADLLLQTDNKEIRGKLETVRLNCLIEELPEKKYPEIFRDLFRILNADLEDDGDELEVIAMEHTILDDKYLYDPQLRRLKGEFPELYALHALFFNETLRTRDVDKMLYQREKKYKKLARQSGTDDQDTDDISEPVRRAQPKVGRNDPCPCGSGKKYKRCCGA
jgi:tetratricopeptide (TPR) repeat protein